MIDKKTITVEIPILDKVDQMKVVETFTEEQLWYVCALAKAFEKKQSNWNSLREELYQANRELVPNELVNGKELINNILNKINELEGKDKE